MTQKKIKLAISTCPNDTFAFHGILTGAVDTRGLNFDIELLDIAALNKGLFAGRFDVAKASFHAAALLTDRAQVLPSGSAIGFGVGPLLLAARENSSPETEPLAKTLCPGQHTTATLLHRIFYPDAAQPEHVVFSDIMPSLEQGRADFGVCIHEGRFTWKESGLFLIEDLGTRWEKESGMPLPLGGILARRNLGSKTIATVARVIHDSIQFGLANRDQTLPTMRRYAQESSDNVLMSHVDLYVNEWTLDLGRAGSDALAHLFQRAVECGLVPGGTEPLEIATLENDRE